MATDFVFSSDNLWTGSLDFIFGGSVLLILRGGSSFITSILADLNSSLEVGCFYITTGGALMKVNSSQLIIEDFYSTSVAGRYNEELYNQYIADLNLL